MSLRDYQTKAIADVRAAVRGGSKRVVLVLPTGAGKTRTGGEIARLAVGKGGRILWLAHRGELVDQAARALRALGLDVGGISASSSVSPQPHAPVQIATVQTLLSRPASRPPATLIVADEAHHYVAEQFRTVLEHYPNALTLGLTATPERSDGRGLGEMYTGLVVGATVEQLTTLGHLVPCEIIRPAKALGRGDIAKHPVDAYVAHAAGTRAIVFARFVDEAESFAAEFNTRGIPAACLHGNTPWGERQDTIARFRSGAIRVLVNVYCLTEGFDAPETETCILARGAGSVGLYLQMVGRVLRPAPGKARALLIDLKGVSHYHGEPADDREYALDGRGISAKAEAVYCPVCGAERAPGEGCESCGWQPDSGGRSELEVTNDPLVKYAAKRAESPEQRRATLERWQAEGRARGHKPGWAAAKFKAVYGSWPAR